MRISDRNRNNTLRIPLSFGVWHAGTLKPIRELVFLGAGRQLLEQLHADLAAEEKAPSARTSSTDRCSALLALPGLHGRDEARMGEGMLGDIPPPCKMWSCTTSG